MANSNPYRTMLPTEFGEQQFGQRGSGYTYDNQTYAGKDEGNLQRYQNMARQYADDPDVAGAMRAGWELQNRNAGTSGAEQTALLRMYQSRIGLKNTLGERIAKAPYELQMAKDLVNQTGSEALQEGTKNTRQNYNSRGLLYSGMRQGGEQKVRGAVAAQTARGIAGAERDVANTVSAAKNAYMNIGLQQQQEQLQAANQAFEVASANNIARLQAMQQLGQGLGSAAGMIYGNYWGRNNLDDSANRPRNTSSPY